MTISKEGLVAGSPQSLNALVDRINDYVVFGATQAANVAANASTPATCVTTPATAISIADATTEATVYALANACKVAINLLIAENAVLKATALALIAENATFKTTINAEIAALKATGIQASA